jgi:hypothetical protein
MDIRSNLSNHHATPGRNPGTVSRARQIFLFINYLSGEFHGDNYHKKNHTHRPSPQNLQGSRDHALH